MRLGRSGRLRRLSAPLIAVASVSALVLSWAPATPAAAVAKVVDVKGFANGMTEHTTALQSGTTRLADTELAWGSAVVNATATGAVPILDEYNHNFSCPPVDKNDACAPGFTSRHSYPRATGLEIGLGT